MKRYIKLPVFICAILGFCFLQSGCAILKLPFQMVDSALSVVGKVLGLAEKLPTPPPGVF